MASIITGTSGLLQVQQVDGFWTITSVAGEPVRKVAVISSMACMCPRGVE